jgi:hypothetical protein
MVLTSPLMLLGLLALPLLAAVYWLRSRSQREIVSSLAFWTDQRRPRRGGRILQRMQTPLCFFLELLAIAMLVAAAAGPALLQKDLIRPLIVVLDDSYSMLAVGQVGNLSHTDSPRRQAEAAVLSQLGDNNYVARFILAGPQPRLLGETVREPTRAQEVLAQWTCQNPSADLAAAMALAVELGGQQARILVLTDRAPTAPLTSGQTEWWAFGSKLPNMAFTAATRTRSSEGQRVLLEVTNLSDSPAKSTLTIEGGNLAAARRSGVQLAAWAARQFFLSLPNGSPPLRAKLDDDSLEIDNHILLLPESADPLRVQVDIAKGDLRKTVRRALEATTQTLEVSQRPDLVICDHSGAMEGSAWRLEILGGKDTVAYAGPFVIDHNHALMQGLSLQDAVWSASSKVSPRGLPIITAGNVTLLTESDDVAGRRRLQMPLSIEQSNIQDMPDWPVFFANLVAWRRNGLPGIAAPNVRLGQTVQVVLAGEVEKVEVAAPSEPRRELPVRSRHVAVPADRVGLYAIKTPDVEYQFSCNAVSRDESDLADCRTGRWGSWADSPTYQDRQASLIWVLLLVALAAMTWHAAVIARDVGYASA